MLVIPAADPIRDPVAQDRAQRRRQPHRPERRKAVAHGLQHGAQADHDRDARDQEGEPGEGFRERHQEGDQEGRFRVVFGEAQQAVRRVPDPGEKSMHGVEIRSGNR
ncbi:MAG: hypothetical protein WDN08_06900 [Rhizomicrobium sp.]